MDGNISLSAATEKISSMVSGAIALLPNLVIGFVIFVVFWIIGKALRAFIKRKTRHRDSEKAQRDTANTHQNGSGR